MSLPPTITPERQLVATGLGVATLVCAVLFFLSVISTMSEVQNTGDSAPPFYPGIIMVGGFICTFPFALVFTIVALALVGPARCRLAWVSLGAFLAPFVLGFIWSLFA